MISFMNIVIIKLIYQNSNSVFWDKHILRKAKGITEMSIVELVMLYGSEIWVISDKMKFEIMPGEMESSRAARVS
jgi:hypothetical protein